MITGTFALQSCVDNDYDLDDIDMTIGLGSDDAVFWLPNSSTEEIVLGDFIKLKDGDYIQVETDDSGKEFYCIKASGNDNIQVSVYAGAPAGTPMDITYGGFDPIDLSMDPEGIKDLNLDLAAPMLLVDIENDAPVNIDCKMVFDCYTSNSQSAPDAEGIDLTKFSVAANSTAHYCFTDNTMPGYSYGGYDYTYKQSTNLHNKVMTMPDKVQMNVKDITMTNVATSGSAITEDVKATFTLYSPLTVGPNFSFTNDSNEKGLYSEMKIDDDTDLDIKAICLKAKVKNNMPIDLDVTAIAMEEDGTTIANIKPLKTNKVLAGQTTEINLRLETVDGIPFTSYLKEGATQKLDGVKLSIKASGNATSSAAPLRPTDSIKVQDMQLGIIGRVIIDAN